MFVSQRGGAVQALGDETEVLVIDKNVCSNLCLGMGCVLAPGLPSDVEGAQPSDAECDMSNKDMLYAKQAIPEGRQNVCD